MLRPGRLDKILYVGFPGPRDRLEILKAITKGGTRPRLGEEVDLDKIGTDSRSVMFALNWLAETGFNLTKICKTF